MKSAILAILFPFAAVAEALTPDTIKDDIPGTATIGEIVTAGGSARPADVHRIVDGSFNGGTQEVNRVTGAFDGVAGRVGDIESRTNLWNSALQEESDPTVAGWAKKPNPRPVTDLSPAINYTTAVSNKLENGKQDTIADLQAIREGAALGATALQEHQSLEPATNYADSVKQTLIDAMPDGTARPLPKYLHALDFADSYPEEAEAYYASRGDGKVDGGCSAVRSGGYLYRNFDYPFDDRAEFVVRVSAASERFASVGVSQVGTNLTEQIVTSGKPSRWYKALPGATVDGINEHGVVVEINVVDGDPQTSGWHSSGGIHPLAAVRWALDHATNAQHAATFLAANIRFPQGWTQNFHYMIADETSTYIVENGSSYPVPSASSPTGALAVLTNFRLYGDPKDTTGEGQERYIALTNGANITSQWWTLTYTANGYRASDLPGITGDALTQLFNYWASKPRESHRGESFGDKVWWQTVHTSVYDITNRVLRVAVQETADFYTFQVPASGGGTDEAKVREIAGEVVAPVASSVSSLQSSKLDKSDVIDPTTATTNGPAADAKATGVELTNRYTRAETDAKLAGKRDKADRAVYGDSVGPWSSPPDGFVMRTEQPFFYDEGDFVYWVWEGESPEGLVSGFVATDIPIDFVGEAVFDGGDYVGRFTSRRDASVIQKQNQQLAAVATGDTQTPANGDLVKYDAANDRFVKATAGTDYPTVQQLAGKASKAVSPTPGNLASLTETGDLEDSGIAKTNVATKSEVVASTNALAETIPNEIGKRGAIVTTADGNSYFTFNPDMMSPQFDVYATLNVYGSLYGVDQAVIRDLEVDEQILLSGEPVVYGITVNGGEPMNGDVNLTIPEASAKTLSTMLADANTNQTADCECISTNICKLIAPELNRTVNANLNTYIDGDTGVEYVGKFYGGNLYYVPTGNVYPPNE